MKESKRTYRWNNYGDINFIQNGGCLVRETDYPECYEVMYLHTDLHVSKENYKVPMIVAHCFVDLSDWLQPDNKKRKEFLKEYGFLEEDFIPSSLEEKQLFCSMLVDNWGSTIWEFNPTFPKITGLNCYSCPYPFEYAFFEKMIVSKTIAVKFMREYGVPYRYLRGK